MTRCKTWSSGRTAILGDAAHAQPPNLGQGGGMAMQNGLALATFLEKVQDARDIPEALEAWENNEREIVEHCQKWSCLYGEIDQAELLIVLRQLAQAFGGVQAVAEQAQLNPTQLYRTLSPKGNPALSSLTAILKAMGLRLAVQPL